MNKKNITAEAEIYRDQGLYKEAQNLYLEVLDANPDLNADERASIQEEIDKLAVSIKAAAGKDAALESKDVSLIKNMWTDEDNAAETLSSATSLLELGLFKEALEQFSQLLASELPEKEYIPQLASCIWQSQKPSQVPDFVEKLTEEMAIGKPLQAELKEALAAEMERNGHEEQALDVLKSVQALKPDDKDVGERIHKLQEKQTYDSRYSYLLEVKKATTEQLQQALGLSKKTGKSVEHILVENLGITKEDVGKSLALFYKCPFRSFNPDTPTPYELLSNLKKAYLTQNNWVPLGWEMSTGTVSIFIDDPVDLMKTDNISALIKAKKYDFVVGIPEDIRQTIDLFFSEQTQAGQDMADDQFEDDLDMIPDIDFEEEEDFEEDFADELNESSSQVVRMVDQIIISAYRKGASDIHIEPSLLTKKVAIRFRIDGVCQDILQVPLANSRGILSRLKIMSGLDIAEKRLPQDGKIKFRRKGIKPFELRMATLPTAGAMEDAVLRILAESGAMKLDDMQLNDRNLSILKKIITQPYGLILVVGPTGSGKTTTLHSVLAHINKPGIKIWTAEDPVEITQQGLRQVECKSKIGLDFARIMRAFLRADPDVIMIGEMRDQETAAIGIEASLTGHLVMSTLHTNSAPETITRLLDMGLNPLNFSDAFLGVLAQRLVRRLCSKCQEEYTLSSDQLKDLAQLYGPKAFAQSALADRSDAALFSAKGCPECSNTGYRGRMGIHEMMHGSGEIKRMIKSEANTEDLLEQAMSDGMLTLVQDGIHKVFDGFTDLQEVQRVCVS